MSENKTSINIDVLSIAEAAVYANVSTKTIERYAILYKWRTQTITKNNRKIKVYRVSDLDKHFKTEKTVSETKSETFEKQKVNESDTNLDLKEEVKFLRSELTARNEFITKYQEDTNLTITQLIDSEARTKTLLADLQMQLKAKALPEPEPVKAKIKKHTWIWWAAFTALIAVICVGAWLGYNYISESIKGLF